MITEITDIRNVNPTERFLAWSKLVAPLPFVAPAALFSRLHQATPPWVTMWLIAFALFAGAKGITLRQLRGREFRPASWRLLAYLFLWPGMNARAFCLRRVIQTPADREWFVALVRILAGMAIVWIGLRLIPQHYALLIAWTGMVGLVLVLHFGIFEVVSLAWREVGVNAQPLMRAPLTARSLSEFWRRRWNAAFSELTERHLFIPLTRSYVINGNCGRRGKESLIYSCQNQTNSKPPHVGSCIFDRGPKVALLASFAASGLVHELVISVPARGGYGLPTLYFILQGIGVLFERSGCGRKLGLGSGWKGWCFVALVAGLPAFWLFHPVFIHNVILPMLHAIGAT